MSVNPARSTGPVVFVVGWAFGQLWLFWVAPIAGALLAGLVYRWFEKEECFFEKDENEKRKEKFSALFSFSHLHYFRQFLFHRLPPPQYYIFFLHIH